MDQARLAELLMADLRQLSERAESEGVTAYLRRPKQRERPNQRFLRSTIASVEQANQRAQEDEMWARRRSQLERETGGGQHREASPRQRPGVQERRSSDAQVVGAEPAAREEGTDDERLERRLAHHPRRGRGGTGSRVDFAGPYVEGAAAAAEPENEDTAVRRAAGPEKPAWMTAGGDRGGESGLSMTSSDSEGRRRRHKSSAKRKEGERRKHSKKHKKREEKSKKRERKQKRKRGDSD